MTAQEVKDYLVENGCEGAIVYDDYPDAFLGHTPQGCAVYDYNKIVETLMNEGESEEDARDWIDYNIIGAHLGDLTPVIVFPVTT